eukprot:tig00021318_g20138.t1
MDIEARERLLGQDLSLDVERRQKRAGGAGRSTSPVIGGGSGRSSNAISRSWSEDHAGPVRVARAYRDEDPKVVPPVWLLRKYRGVTYLNWLRIVFITVISIVVVVGVLVLRLDRYLPIVLEWISNQGILGPILLAVAHAICTVILFPGSVLCFGAGFLFGWFLGTIAVFVGETLGALLAFLLGRTLLADLVERLAQSHPKFLLMDRAIEQQGWRIVFLLRLSPILPFNVINYMLAVTKIRFHDYAMATAAGVFPSTWLFVYVGSTANDIADITKGLSGQDKTSQIVLMSVCTVLTIISVVLVTFYSKRAMQRVMQEPPPPAELLPGRDRDAGSPSPLPLARELLPRSASLGSPHSAGDRDREPPI